MGLRWLLSIYGLVNIVGGVFAFTAVKSQMSLIVGGLSGIALLGCAALAGSKPSIAFRTAGLLCLGLAGFWTYRLTQVQAEGKSIMMPMGNLALALGVVVALGLAHRSAVKRRSTTSG